LLYCARLSNLVVHPRLHRSTWRKLNEAGRSVKELGDVAQLRVVLVPRAPAGAALPLDYGWVALLELW
jgi:hypothetical protein